MLNTDLMNTLVEKISKIVPAEVFACKAELSQSLRAILESTLSKLNLITREEFDVKKSVLLKTRRLLSNLEKQVAQLEAALDHATVKKDTQD